MVSTNSKSALASSGSRQSKRSETADNRPWDERFRPRELCEVVGNTNVSGTLERLVDEVLASAAATYAAHVDREQRRRAAAAAASAESARIGNPNAGDGGKGKKRSAKTAAAASAAEAAEKADGSPPAPTKPLPHFIFSGPPGTGKTSTALCLAKRLLGGETKSEEAIAEGLLELNSTDDKTLERVRAFARTKVRHVAPFVPRIVVLDEVDHLSGQNQQMLRRVLNEKYIESKIRFILVCNNSSKVIAPIQSKCCMVRFVQLKPDAVERRVRDILDHEGIAYTKEGIQAIVFTADGDMRQAINNLQSVHVGHGDVTAEHVFMVADQPHPKLVRKLVDECVRGNVRAAVASLTDLWKKGFPASDIIGTLFRVVRLSMDLPENIKFELLREISVVHKRSVEGCSSALQLSGLCTRLCQVTNCVRTGTE